jgi:hypothetical protein
MTAMTYLRSFVRALIACVSLVGAGQLAWSQDRSIAAPASATVGARIEVAWRGEADERDFIAIVPADAPEGRYLGYEYTRRNPVTLTAPQQPGNYEVRYLAAASPYPTLARSPITIVDTTAKLRARFHRPREGRCRRRHVQRAPRLHAQRLAVDAARAR